MKGEEDSCLEICLFNLLMYSVMAIAFVLWHKFGYRFIIRNRVQWKKKKVYNIF